MVASTDPWGRPPAPGTDPLVWGSGYLQAVRQVAPRAQWIELPGDGPQRLRACTWIGQSIHVLNAHLDQGLQEVLVSLRVPPAPLRIWAAPLASYAGIDGFCNAQAHPHPYHKAQLPN